VILRVSRLNGFYGRARALTDVDLAVAPGETVALLGRNGAGKSTVMKCVIGLIRDKTGTIEFDGRAIQALPPHRISRLGLGYVPEERRIFADLTVRENLEVGRRTARGAGRWPLERIFEVFPNLAGMRDRPGGAMSGGEQQMLTVARALMGNPKMLLLDEPSEGLAPLIVQQMAHMIRELQTDGLAILLSEQNMHFAAAVAGRAYVIERGVIRHEGRPRDIIADPKLRAAYLAV
jgi:branched-chain amino acid transport system ATP-binding protein